MVNVLIWLIRAYQRISRPLFPSPSCRFAPSCSQYAICAFQKYGLIKGAAKSLWRGLRCNGFSSGGYDPVK